MTKMRILLFDTSQYAPTTPLFGPALESLAQEGRVEFVFVDEAEFVAPVERSLAARAFRKLLGRPHTAKAMNRRMVEVAAEFRPDVVLVVKGTYLTADTLDRIRDGTGAVLANYATDDPFNPVHRDSRLLESLLRYDLVASTKRAIIPDLEDLGCPRVEFIPFAYQPAVHFPEAPTSDERERFRSDVVFIGGADDDRAPYFERLLDAIPDLDLSLYGGFWDRYRSLAPYHRGFATGRDYRLALNGAKIAVNLVRRANRDDHVMRTFEVPACGAFMLAERTPTHKGIFEDGEEAAFFDTPDDLVERVGQYLDDDHTRRCVAAAGRARIVKGAHTYRDRLEEILSHLNASSTRRPGLWEGVE